MNQNSNQNTKSSLPSGVRQRVRRRKQNRSGAAMVEFAIMAPIFFLIVFASFEFIRLNMIRNLVQDAAYFACRDAIVPGATEEEAAAVANKLLGFMNTKGATVVVNNGNPLNNASEEVTVTITVPVADNSFLIPTFSEGMVFSATATMATERYHGYYHPED